MGLPANVPLGAGCWVVAMLIAIRILWILPFTSPVPVWVKAVTSIAIFIIAVMVSRRTVQEAYRKQSAGEELTSDTKALLGALEALEGRIDAVKKSEPSSVPDKLSLGRPREHTHVKLALGSVQGDNWYPFKPGKVPRFLMALQNIGEFPVRRSLVAAQIVLKQGVSDPNKRLKIMTGAFEDFAKHAKFLPFGAILPHSPTMPDFEYHGPMLEQQDISNLSAGNAMLCSLGRAKWKDDTGCYQTDFCQCLIAEPAPTLFNSHQCTNINDDEQTLKCSAELDGSAAH